MSGDIPFKNPDEILDALTRFSGPVVVDLDETIYLGNSTEDFIALARPYFLAAYILRALDLLRPWRLKGGPSVRDNWHVLVIMLFFPWTILRWRKFCRETAPARFNMPLLDVLNAHKGMVVIATNGYRRLVEPLLSGSRARAFPLVSCGLRAFSHRVCGKAALVEQRFGNDFIGQAAMVTDSLDDRKILSLSRLPLLGRWPGVVKNANFRDFAYVPGDYLNRVKQPNQRVWRILLREDVLPWLLVCLSGSVLSPVHAIGALLLFASLWAVYEAGYFDNDKCAVKYESDPKIKPEFKLFSNPWLEIYCWIWGLGIGGGAVFLLQPDHWLSEYAQWIALLIACRITYFFYNRIDKNSRVLVYPLLQAFRFGAPFAVIGVDAVGAAIVISQIVPRWYEYALYRYVRKQYGTSDWPKTPMRTFRFETFVLLLAGIVLLQGFEPLWTVGTFALVLFAYPVFRFEARGIRADFSMLSRAPKNGS